MARATRTASSASFTTQILQNGSGGKGGRAQLAKPKPSVKKGLLREIVATLEPESQFSQTLSGMPSIALTKRTEIEQHFPMLW